MFNSKNGTKRKYFLGFFNLTSLIGSGFSIAIVSYWLTQTQDGSSSYPILIYIIIIVPIFVGSFYLLKSFLLPYPVVFYYDLKHLGFNGEGLQSDFLSNVIIACKTGVSVIPDNTLPPNRVKAFLSYGFKTLRRLESFEKISEEEYDSILKGFYNMNYKDRLRKLTFQSIQESTKILKKENCSKLRQIPLSAYLFRTASVNLDARDKENQEKAILLWKGQRDLDLVFELRDHSLEKLKAYENLPDSWVKEVNALSNGF